jgi:hypothetical protein
MGSRLQHRAGRSEDASYSTEQRGHRPSAIVQSRVKRCQLQVRARKSEAVSNSIEQGGQKPPAKVWSSVVRGLKLQHRAGMSEAASYSTA